MIFSALSNELLSAAQKATDGAFGAFLKAVLAHLAGSNICPAPHTTRELSHPAAALLMSLHFACLHVLSTFQCASHYSIWAHVTAMARHFVLGHHLGTKECALDAALSAFFFLMRLTLLGPHALDSTPKSAIHDALGAIVVLMLDNLLLWH